MGALMFLPAGAMELQTAARLGGAEALVAGLLLHRATALVPFVSAGTQMTLMLAQQAAVIEESSMKGRQRRLPSFRRVRSTRLPVRVAPLPLQQRQHRVTSPGARCKPCKSSLLLQALAV